MLNEESNRIIKKFNLFYETIMNNCRLLINQGEKLTYLKKIIDDCDKIIELAEIFDDPKIDGANLRNVFSGIDDNFYWLLDEHADGPPNDSLMLKENTEYFIVAKLFNNKSNVIVDCIDGIETIKKTLKQDINKINEEENQKNISCPTDIERIKIKSSLTDVVRIFEAMKKAEIIFNKTEVKQFAQLFYSEPIEKLNFERKYNSAKSRIIKEKSSSNSKELVEFIKYLCEDGLIRKDSEIDEIIKHLEQIQKKQYIRYIANFISKIYLVELQQIKEFDNGKYSDYAQ
jgi:hypothetical protein